MRKWTRSERNFLERERALTRVEWTLALEDLVPRLSSLVEAEPSAKLGREFIAGIGGLRDWLEGDGLIRVWQGDPAGWDVIHDGVEYSYWSTLMFEEIYQRDTRPNRYRNRLTLSSFSEVLLGLHLGRKDAADAVLLRIVREARENECKGWRTSTGALAFQLRLYELWTGESAGMEWEKVPPLGSYEALLATSVDSAEYGEQLAWACAEHIAQTRDSNQRFPPFTTGMFRTLPIELILWLRYRQRLGLTADTDEHPLLESALAVLSPPPRSTAPSPFRALLDRALPHLQEYLRGASS